MTDKQQEWLDQQCLLAIDYLKLKGFNVDGIIVNENKYLMPLFSLWKFDFIDNRQCWVIGGDLPIDHACADVAFNTREAVHHFSLKWQLQAEHLMEANMTKQTKLAQLLSSKSKTLFQMFNDESLWLSDR